MEIRTLQIGNITIPYELHRKNMKRCYLRLQSGKVKISASPHFTIKEIESFVLQYQNKIIKHIQEYEPKYCYEDGGYVFLFGKKYEIVLCDRNQKQCRIHENLLYVYHHNIEEVVEKYVKKELLAYVNHYILHCQNVVTTIPEVTIRKMKSRWGSCFTTRNKICLNFALIHLEYGLIEYVILHELCHFLQANHSPLFYYEIEKRMPDYKRRIKKLKETVI